MPTTKKRINITVNSELEKIIGLLAKRDNMPQATKTVELLKKAIEIEEDDVWNMIAEERMAERKTKKLDLISYEDLFGASI